MNTTDTIEPPQHAAPDNDFEPVARAPQRPPAWLAASAISAAALEACGGGGSDADAVAVSPGVSSLATTTPAGIAAVAATTFAGGAAGPLGMARTYAVPASDNDAARFLLQCQFNASDSDIALTHSLGYAGFLAQQFNVVPVSNAWTWLTNRGYAAIDGNSFAFTPYQIDFALWQQIFTSNDNVRKRVTLALSEIFVVSSTGIDYFWLCHLVANWWDTLSAGSLGTYRALLEKVMLHPAMGMYLNTLGSQQADSTGREPDENFAREVMQLMSIGLVQLNQDGTPIVSGGVPLQTYSQDDVSNLAQVFTGYGINWTANTYTWYNGLPYPSTLYTRLPMVLNPSLHSPQAANFLGASIPANTDGNIARGLALDVLANHPNVGPFIGKQLIQKLVTSNPSPAYVARVSAAFANNGLGVRGDLAATVAAVLLDDEARGPAGLTSTTYGRVREPMLRMAQWGRTFGISSARGSWKVYDQSSATQLSQSPLRAASVFNFYRPGYVPPDTAMATQGLAAPEFQMVNETTVSAYINYMLSVVRWGVYIGAPDLPQIAGDATDGFDVAATYVNELPLAADAASLVARLNLLLAAGQLSSDTVTLIVNALNAYAVTASSSSYDKLDRIAAGVLMVMSSSEYLVQK